MMSNERQRQASTPVVVAKDNLKKKTQRKGYLWQNITTKNKQTNKKQNNTYLKRLTHKTDG